MVGGVWVFRFIFTNEIPQECLGGMWEDRSVTAKLTTQCRNACIMTMFHTNTHRYISSAVYQAWVAGDCYKLS